MVKHHVLALFRASLEDGSLPSQWRHAKIIPLKKPGKEDYTMAKAWRPISLLATLGKVLESVVAERISHAVETHGLLPTNHFGARKQRSAEQALVFLQEQIYTAWRGRKVVSLISFDVKGAYNGVCKERLVQRIRARGIPEELCRWTEAFCSDRTASIQINGRAAEVRNLPQAGLPQGSPLSPILFLFFNADLVQRRTDSNGGAIAFVDDFTAWVTGPTAQSTAYPKLNTWWYLSDGTLQHNTTGFTKNRAISKDKLEDLYAEMEQPAGTEHAMVDAGPRGGCCRVSRG